MKRLETYFVTDGGPVAPLVVWGVGLLLEVSCDGFELLIGLPDDIIWFLVMSGKIRKRPSAR